ncbi:hypothetical protein RJ55_00990 [Drechmeria coniospora]|nr:hypothetical protein RJ55_00990 [Drechmeria coniospora]
MGEKKRAVATAAAAARRRWPDQAPEHEHEHEHQYAHQIDGEIPRLLRLHDAERSDTAISWTRGALYIQDGDRVSAHGDGVGDGRARPRRRLLTPTTLRDSCTCVACRDPASGNKSFGSVEIPLDIGLEDVRSTERGLAIRFRNDIPRYRQTLRGGRAGAEGGHEMLLPWSEVNATLGRRRRHAECDDGGSLPRKRSILRRTGVRYWDGATLERHIRRIDYDEYMRQDSPAFWDAVIDICRLGIVYLVNVPRSEESVVAITTRLANIRETFYGRTFDVRAKVAAENVAYTTVHLGLHQDLLYLDPPPMIQVLHCMDNDCDGGESLFSDGERVGRLLWPFARHPSSPMAPLAHHNVPYGYDKNGHRYMASRPVIALEHGNDGEGEGDAFAAVHWSPPFQAPHRGLQPDLGPWIGAARVFESLVNADDALHSRKMAPGECVIFDNLRLMHGRTAFDTSRGGSRWLRGAYIAAEDFLSTASHIPKGRAEALRGPVEWSPELAQKDLMHSPWHRHVLERVKTLHPTAVA